MTRASGELCVYDAPADVAKALAELFVESAREAVGQRGCFAVSLAGGTTPKAAYALLAQPAFSGVVDWARTQIFFGDERCVPPSDPQSNYRMAREAFLDAVGVPPSNVHRIEGERDPAQAAAAYRDVLLATLGPEPRFDLVMLGMGPDGHTASLFPGSDPLSDDAMLVRAVYSSSQEQWRVTLTPRVLNGARIAAFAVEGNQKAATLARVRNGEYQPTQLPSQIVAPRDGRLLWLVDKAAAG